MTFKNEKGLTLIELLITIAVIAIVAAISIPVITNVIDSARTSSAGSMEAQVNAFIEQYAASGKVTFNGTDTFTGWVDLDADGVADANEAIETFTVDITQFALSNTPNGTNAGVGDPYASFPSATATVTVGGGTGAAVAGATTVMLTGTSGALVIDNSGVPQLWISGNEDVALIRSLNIVAGSVLSVTDGTGPDFTVTINSVNDLGDTIYFDLQWFQGLPYGNYYFIIAKTS
jgi:prepilin-type N-terminal cleavage/methylation domain-containing protein